MSIQLIESLFPENATWRHHCEQIKAASTFSHLIWLSLQAGLWVALRIAESHLNERGKAATSWPSCPSCGTSLHSKGLRARQLNTLIGVVRWHRRVGRCPRNCPGSQRIPSDEALGISPYQSTDEGFQRLGCLLSLMLPYQMASGLLGQWTGITLSPSTLWNTVQNCGATLMAQQEQEQQSLAQGHKPEAETLPNGIAELILAISVDGVMVPFRPQAKTPKGKTQYREVKIGLLARLGKRLKRNGESVTQLYHRRVVAVLGDLEAFIPLLQLEAHRQSFKQAPQVLWLSDGAKGFWRIYRTCFQSHAVGILDFYHAAGHLWRAAAAAFDGRSTVAKKWFRQWRHLLRHGQERKVLKNLTQLINTEVFDEDELQTLQQVQAYFQRHQAHIRYQDFERLDYPRGSGMIESTCKWLIQQRFKGVGMRWSEDGFNHLLLLRVAWVNQRFDPLFPQVTWVEHLPSPTL